MSRINIELDPDLHRRIRVLSVEQGKPLAAVVGELLSVALAAEAKAADEPKGGTRP